MQVGPGTDLGSGMLLDLTSGADASLEIGSACVFENAIRLQILGGRLQIGDASEVRDSAVLKVSMPTAQLRLGHHVKVGRGATVHCRDQVSIEDYATLGERVTVVDSFHDVDGSDVWTMEQPVGSGPVHIGRNVLVLSGAVVLHGVTIGRNAVVAANAIVPSGDHAPGCVLFGVPARAVRRLPCAPADE